MAAVERRTLLRLMQQRAVEVGVDVRFATEVEPDDLLAAGYDLVVAADGANSRLRERLSPTRSTPASRRRPPSSSGSAPTTRSTG